MAGRPGLLSGGKPRKFLCSSVKNLKSQLEIIGATAILSGTLCYLFLSHVVIVLIYCFFST